MCFYYSIVKTTATKLVKNKITSNDQLSMIDNHYFANGFSHPLMPVIQANSNGKITPMRWGLVPPTIGSANEADRFVRNYNTLNARGETIFEGKVFSDHAIKRRCLVLASGFFEWQHRPVAGSKKVEKIPYYISMNNDEMFVFGGIWNSFIDKETGETVPTFSIVTTNSNPLMSDIHNTKKRMPLIIEPELAHYWLNTNTDIQTITQMIKPLREEKMKAHTIGKINIHNGDNDRNSAISANFDYPILNSNPAPTLFDFN